MPHSEYTCTLYSTQLHTVHQDIHLTPLHYPYIQFTSNPAHNSLSCPAFSWSSPYFISLHFTSIQFTYHLSLSNLSTWKYSISSILQNHFTSLRTFLIFYPCIYLISPQFKIPHFPSLITFRPLFLEILNFLPTSKSLHFTSLPNFLIQRDITTNTRENQKVKAKYI